MTNIRCKGGKEIDLLAINPKTGEKYHVESSVKPAFKLKVKTTYTKQEKSHRDGIDFFVEKKFNHPLVLEKIHEIFGDTNYRKWLVVWSVQEIDSVFREAEAFGIEIQFIGYFLDEMIRERLTKGSRDDILRTIEFVSIHEKIREQALKRYSKRGRKTVVSRIIEKRIGTGILSKEELSRWKEVFKENLREIGLTVEEFLASPKLEKEAVWEEFRKHIS